ncbi:MAG: GNAT family N-acetyltransferase [Candidatus Marinimicrobia bacterium]|nr:GNAT family N-acetyltransferase [Candidatus Neomarinimicrobiota bacterium]
MIRVYSVKSRRDLKRFIMLPWKIYKNDRNWVPPLIVDQKELFNRKKYPFFEHSEAEFFLAERDGEVLGRIAAIKNNMHLKIYNDGVGFFGFFECTTDQDIAKILFEKAEEWLAERGLKKIRGPANYSINEEIGLLVDDFKSPPVIMMPYNPRYYEILIVSQGYKKIMDLYAYQIVKQFDKVPEELEEKVKKIKERASFVVRKIDMKHLDEEVEKIKEIYNQAWSENWGAVPLTDSEIEHLKNNLKLIVDPDLVFIAERDGKPVGLSLTIPDFNEVLIKMNGRLLPFGIFKLLLNKNKIKGLRTLIMGVLKEYRKIGIDTVFYYETIKNGLEKGYEKCEMSWILETNKLMIWAIENLSMAKRYKTYRIYEKDLG